MTILEWFRTQARDKHPDPAVRLAFVEEVPLEARDLIESMARHDEDPRVRCAAVAKLLVPGVLGIIARDDRDEAVRGRAAAMLRDIALDTFEGITESDSLEAVDAVADTRVLAQIAKTAPREAVAMRALGALGRGCDVHVLGSIARHAAAEGARRGALDLVLERGDRGELLAVAMHSEHKDTSLAAMEHITEQSELEQIATRGTNKSAVKRARSVLRDAAEQAARAAAAASRQAAESVQPDVAPEAGVDQAVLDQERTRAAEEFARAMEEAEQREAREREAAAERARQQAERDAATQAAEARRREMAEREAAAKEADARLRRDALARLNQLIARVAPLADKPDLTLKAADRALRDIRAALGAIPPLPSRQDFDLVTSRLNAALEVLTPKALSLREAAEWQRFANIGIQEQLCESMEALATVEDPEVIARQVRDLQQQWKLAADVPRAQAEGLWRRFKTAHDNAWARCEAHFAVQAQVRAENLAKKTALAEKAETLADSTNWLQTAEDIKALQAEWKTIGPVSRGREKAVWDRFRLACDRFFTRRNEDLARRKATWAENLAKKEALCAQAEALAESTEWEEAAAQLKRLQAEWKTIGPVKRSRSEAIWQRFRGAADKFFARYAQRHDMARAERVAAREAICAELETLAAQEEGVSSPDLLPKVRALRGRWQQEIAARGVDPDTAHALDGRFSAALAALTARVPAVFSGTDLDLEANRKRLHTLVKKVEDLAASLTGGLSATDQTPATRLAAMLKEALAANTIGGKADDDSKWRTAMDEVRQAQASWARLLPLSAADAADRRALTERFQRACRRITERAGRTGR